MGKEIRSSTSPTLLPPSAFAAACAGTAHLPSLLLEAGTHPTPGVHLAMEAGRGQVHCAWCWAQLFPGNVPKELSSFVPACGLAGVEVG